MPASSYQQQKLRVCEVCSAYLGIHDNDRRLADHFGGKLHLGFIKIREKLAELEVRISFNNQHVHPESVFLIRWFLYLIFFNFIYPLSPRFVVICALLEIYNVAKSITVLFQICHLHLHQ